MNPPESRDATAEAALRQELAAATTKLDALDARIKQEFPRFAQLINPEPLKSRRRAGIARARRGDARLLGQRKRDLALGITARPRNIPQDQHRCEGARCRSEGLARSARSSFFESDLEAFRGRSAPTRCTKRSSWRRLGRCSTAQNSFSSCPTVRSKACRSGCWSLSRPRPIRKTSPITAMLPGSRVTMPSPCCPRSVRCGHCVSSPPLSMPAPRSSVSAIRCW